MTGDTGFQTGLVDRTPQADARNGAVASSTSNYGLKDEIRAYWSKRAESFDLSFGHKIRSEAELAGWQNLLARHWRPQPGDRVLELASGTGEFTRVLLALGCSVDAIDLCEPMIARSRAKHGNAPVRFHLGDAENTMMPDEAYDAALCRHLVWTLVDPRRALADWLRVLRPGGTLVIVDGDWVNRSRRAVLLNRLSGLIDRWAGTHSTWDRETHERILHGVHFSAGLSVAGLSAMLSETGFTEIVATPLSGIRRHQFASASWSERLRVIAAHDRAFVVSARKPVSADHPQECRP